MRKRGVLLGVAALAAGMLASGALWRSASPITPGNVDRLRAGLPRAEVVALLGPPGRYDGAEFGVTGSTVVLPDDPDVWVSRTAAVKVHFDDALRVTAITRGLPVVVHQTWVDRLRRWLRL